jgi:translation initiation factor IF-2
MRSRGAKATDIVVLVVAADDGVMPQTVEAIDHAHAAEVPIIVAVNKIDKPGALPDRVKKQLGDRGLMPEEWGGTTVFVDVSAKQKTNLNLLMEMICLVADLQELRATPDRPAQGVVLEAKLDRGRGPVATVLVQNGTLHDSDNFVVGNVYGKVRAMFDDRGNALKEAPPSTPVEILGMEGLPQAGDQFVVVADRDKARGISEYREQKTREATLAKSSRVSLEGLAEQLKTAGTKELNIILKADVGGSVEVLSDLLSKLSNDKVRLKVLHSGVGAITETDVLLASASNAIIIGFSVRPERKAQELADQEKVDIRLHSIIYELQDEIKRAMTGLLEPTIKETYQGRAEVRETFRIPKVGTIAGCTVTDGLIKRDSEVRLLRDNVVVFKGKVGSLRRFKDDASQVTNGMECGISIANYSDIKVGDVIEAFVTEKIAAEAMAWEPSLVVRRWSLEILFGCRKFFSAVASDRGPTTNDPMIAFLTLELTIEAAQSLKDKRQVVRSLKDRLRAHFNVAVAELDASGLWNRATLGVVSISDSRDYLDGLMKNVERQATRIANNGGADIADSFLEYL